MAVKAGKKYKEEKKIASKKIMKRLSVILILVLCFSIVSHSKVYAVNALKENVDMDLTREKSQKQEVLSTFLKVRSGNTSYEELNEIVKKIIPEGSWCTDVSVLGEVLYIDYRIDNVRYILGYCSDGTVEKVARDMNGDTIYARRSDREQLDIYDVKENEELTQISYEDALRYSKQLKEANLDLSSMQNDARATTKEVYPLKYTSASSTAPYKGRPVDSGNVTISELRDLGYSSIQPYRVYETMSYHSEVVKKTQAFAIGSTMATIASAFVVSVGVVESWLTTAEVLFSTSDILQEACKVVKENEYTYYGGKECVIYDPTETNAYVEVYSHWSQGVITMTWQYNSSTGYRSPMWGHSVQSDSLRLANSTVRDQGKQIYINSLNMYGFWRGGVGNGIGY